MRTGFRKAMVLAAGLLVFAGGTANAEGLRVKVPFPFVVEGRQFPAGEYRVQRDDTNPSIVFVRPENRHSTGMYVATIPASGHDPAGDKPALIFKRDEKQYRLTDVWESADTGHEVPGSR